MLVQHCTIHDQKYPGNPAIPKYRVIQHIQAEMYFLSLHLWGKCLVHHAFINKALSVWNFGGCPGVRVQRALLLKTISYNSLRHIYHNDTISDNKAKACFDIMVPSLGLRVTKPLGEHQSATASMVARTKAMHFVTCTAHSTSPGF
jgi:hypothetical protein